MQHLALTQTIKSKALFSGFSGFNLMHDHRPSQNSNRWFCLHGYLATRDQQRVLCWSPWWWGAFRHWGCLARWGWGLGGDAALQRPRSNGIPRSADSVLMWVQQMKLNTFIHLQPWNPVPDLRSTADCDLSQQLHFHCLHHIWISQL